VDTTQESFDALLAWLDFDREVAGQKYEIIRAGLIRIFVSKGFNDAEDLADQSVHRVIARLPDIRDGYVGEQGNYFHGVARNIIREASRRKEVATDVFPIELNETKTASAEYECLLECLSLLPSNKRELILDYHLYEGQNKIQHHKRMARELAITENALRGRAHNLRLSLENCVVRCTQNVTSKQKMSWRA